MLFCRRQKTVVHRSLIGRLRPYCFCVALIFSTPFCSSAFGLGLYASYLATLKHNKPLLEAQWAFLGSQDANDVAKAALKPSLALSITGGADDFRTKMHAETSTSKSNQSYALAFSQTLLDKVAWYAWQQAKEEGRYDFLTYLIQRQDLIVSVAEQYCDLLSAAESLHVLQTKKRWVKAQLEKAHAQLHVGNGLKTSYLQIKAEYEQAQTDYIHAANLVRIKQAAFYYLTGIKPKWLMKLSKKVTLPKLPPQKQWQKWAKTRNLLLVQAKQKQQISHIALAKARAAHGPSLALSADLNHYRTQGDSLSYQPPAGYTASMALTLSMPVYSGGRITAATRLARKQNEINLVRRQDVEETLDLNLNQTYLNVKTNQDALKASNAWVKSSYASFVAENVRFSIRSSDIASYLSSLHAYEDAALNEIKLRYQQITLWLELRKLAGIVTAQDLKTIGPFFHQPVRFPKDIA
jgi:outer membrane protein